MNKIRNDKELLKVCKDKGLFIGNLIKNECKKDFNADITATNTCTDIFESKINEESIDDKKFINAIK